MRTSKRAFRASALIIGEDIAMGWLRRRYDTVGPKQAKLEFLELTSSAALLQKLQVKARELLTAPSKQHIGIKF